MPPGRRTQRDDPRSQETGHAKRNQPSGMTATEDDTMNATTLSTAATRPVSALLGITGAAMLGLFLLILAGHVQAAALHDGAHDTRHATGFPCH